MSKFIVVSTKDIIKYLVLCILILCGLFFVLSNSNYPLSIYTLNSNKDFLKDFTGDGIEDNLIVQIEDNNYIIKIQSSSSEYLLKNSQNEIKLLDVLPSCNIKLDFIDLTRDNIPEIIVTGLKNNKPISYIFSWNNTCFKEFFSSTKNIIGIIDSKNSRTPLIFTTTSTKGDEETTGILFNYDVTKDISFYKYNIPSLGVIQKFIDLIQINYELSETPGLFSPYIPSNELGILWNLDKAKYSYSFQNAYFKDIDWISNGAPKSLIWILSFEKVNTQDSRIKPSEEILYIKTSLDEFGEYTIDSIKR